MTTMPSVVRVPDALPPERARELGARLRAHALVGRSQLTGTFEGSRGFGVAFTGAGRTTVRDRFPFLGPFLDLVASVPVDLLPRRAPWPSRARATPSAFYLNVLVVERGQGVGRHKDGTLGPALGGIGITPAVVSVLYLEIPGDARGGELALYDAHAELDAITPHPGLLVHFRGDLAHEVRPLDAGVGARTSLVCEQYVTDDAERLAPMTLQTRASDPLFAPPRAPRAFAAVLDEKQGKPTTAR